MGFLQPSGEVGTDIFSTPSCLGRTRKTSESIDHPSAQAGKLSELLLATAIFSQPPRPADSLSRSRPDQRELSNLGDSRYEPQVDSTDGETVDVGKHEADEMSQYLERMIGHAKENGLPERLQTLAALVEEYGDVFRIRLGSDPPADIPPMKIILKGDAVPVRVKVRLYAPPQRLLRKKLDEIQSLRLVYVNNDSQ